MHGVAQADKIGHLLARGRTETFYAVLDVTPAMAQRFLELNEGNRPIRLKGRESVETYANAMQRGEWLVNGQDILISDDGLLNDGQHRLMAVIAANMTVRMGFKFGVERYTRHTVDQGVKRTPGHILSMHGEANGKVLAAAIRFYVVNVLEEAPPTSHQLLSLVDEYPEMRDSLPAGWRLGNKFRLSGAAIATAHFLCAAVDRAVADDIVEKTATGIGVNSKSDPVFRLIEAYIGHGSGLKKSRLSPEEQGAFFVKTFNRARGKKGTSVLSYRRSGVGRESFPRPM